MLTRKKNVVVYTVQLDTERVVGKNTNELIELFRQEFEREGMTKEAQRLDKGGFSFRESDHNSYFTEYEISVVTREKML